VQEMEGEVAEWRTRLTSLWPSEDQRSTLRTNMPWSTSLLLLADVCWGDCTTHLQSTSFPVETSVIMRRTQGGGVMGRRSCSGQLETLRLCVAVSAPYLQNRTSSHGEVAAQHGVWESLAAILPSPQTTYSYLHPFSTQERGNGSCIAGCGIDGSPAS
jgi:hypothetical protein